MTYDEASKDCERFIDYLEANGKRPIALIIHLCDDHDNTEQVGYYGNDEQLMDASIAVLASSRGYKVTLS